MYDNQNESEPAENRCRVIPTGMAKSNGGFVVMMVAFQLLAVSFLYAVDPNRDNVGSGKEGDFGASLALLESFYFKPTSKSESNYYFEMWKHQNVRSMSSVAKLGNNRTLFINSHGKALNDSANAPHAYYPHDTLVSDPKNAPNFSARDFAAVMGTDASKIHNIVLAACDRQNSFKPEELLHFFVNVTNIVHVPAGEAGYQPMFLQSFMSHSSEIKPLYESARKNANGVMEYHINIEPSDSAKRLSPYISNLYHPGETIPFRTQIAGKELFSPTKQKQLAKGKMINPSIPYIAPPEAFEQAE